MIENVNLQNQTDQVLVTGASIGDQSVKGVQFRNSEIKLFPKELLKTFPRLQAIDIKGLQLNGIHQRNYIGGSFVETYWAPLNNIVEIGPNVFSYMANIYTLNLSDNPIEFIHALAFSGLAKLTILLLKGTSMKTLSFESFYYLNQVTLVDFENANGRSNCVNEQFSLQKGNVYTIANVLKAKCEPGDPFKDVSLTEIIQLKQEKSEIANEVFNIVQTCFKKSEIYEQTIQELKMEKETLKKQLVENSHTNDCGLFPILTRALINACNAAKRDAKKPI